MTDIWDKLKESVNFYNAEGFIPRRDIRNTIADLVDEGDKLKESLREALSQSRVNGQHRLLYQSQRDEAREKLEAVETQTKGLEGQLKAVKKTLITWVYHYPTKLREALERALGETLIEEAIP